jgi:hypothetical protein
MSIQLMFSAIRCLLTAHRSVYHTNVEIILQYSSSAMKSQISFHHIHLHLSKVSSLLESHFPYDTKSPIARSQRPSLFFYS